MRKFWIIRKYNAYANRWYFLWIDKPNGHRAEWSSKDGVTPLNVHEATHFNTEGEATLCLSHGLKELNWSGEFVIEPIYTN